MALHPVGPLPPATYWRRRLTLLLGALVLLLVARSCVGGSSPSPRTRAGAGASPSATPTATGSAAPTTSPSRSPSPRATTSAAGTGLCPDGVLRVTTRSDATDYKVGTSPRFTVTVTNTSATDCRRDLGGAAVELLVYSGPDRIWSSDDCGAGGGTEVLTLRAGASLEKSVPWSGKRSAPGCPSPAQRTQAKPGTYRVLARVGTLRSAGAVFRLNP
jgi:hypothetical protein